LNHLKVLSRDVDALEWIGIVAGVTVAYLIGTRLAFPFADASKIQAVISESAVLSLMDAFLAGGATGRLALFALGLLPLMMFYPGSMTVVGSRIRIQAQLRPKSLAALVCISALFSLWLETLGALAPGPWVFIGATAYWMVGLLILLKLENLLANRGGPDLLNLNAALVAADYVWHLVVTKNPDDLLTIGLVILFVITFIYVAHRSKSAEIANIRERIVRQAALPLPASNSALRGGLLLMVLICSFLGMSLANFFFALELSPFGSSLPERAFVVACTILVVIGLIRNDVLDGLLGQFNSVGTARRLKRDFWIIPGIEVGAPTAAYLRRQAAMAHRTTYLYYLAWIIVLGLLPDVTARFGMALTEPPFGPLGFVLVLTLCAEVFDLVWSWWRAYTERVDFLTFWTPIALPSAFEISLEEYGLEDTIDRLLGRLSTEERVRLAQFDAENPSISDILKISLAIARARDTDIQTVSPKAILVKLALSAALSLAILMPVVWITQFILGTDIDPQTKVNILLFAVPIFLGWVIALDVHKDVRTAFDSRRRSSAPVPGIAGFRSAPPTSVRSGGRPVESPPPMTSTELTGENAQLSVTQESGDGGMPDGHSQG
jgi:hypothetical protein